MHLDCFLEKGTFEWVKTLHFGPWVWAKKIFWPAMRNELCTPDLNIGIFIISNYQDIINIIAIDKSLTF